MGVLLKTGEWEGRGQPRAAYTLAVSMEIRILYISSQILYPNDYSGAVIHYLTICERSS
jgi:hypothetical protein